MDTVAEHPLRVPLGRYARAEIVLQQRDRGHPQKAVVTKPPQMQHTVGPHHHVGPVVQRYLIGGHARIFIGLHRHPPRMHRTQSRDLPPPTVDQGIGVVPDAQPGLHQADELRRCLIFVRRRGHEVVGRMGGSRFHRAVGTPPHEDAGHLGHGLADRPHGRIHCRQTQHGTIGDLDPRRPLVRSRPREPSLDQGRGGESIYDACQPRHRP